MVEHWTPEKTRHPKAADRGWALVFDPTPGGRTNVDGSKSYQMRFPALLIPDYIDEPEDFARKVAQALNAAGKWC